MCQILLGLVINIRLPNNLSNTPFIRAIRAILDFLYLAQYPVHTSETLKLMDDSLANFHDHKHIFIQLGLRDNFNIPKLHFISHYVRCIKLFGTTDNFNTEYTERLHIDLAKRCLSRDKPQRRVRTNDKLARMEGEDRTS